MSKLKLNIQYFGSTNKTTHYNLSQYVASDKPTYLVDYNSDMLAIDTAIYNAMSKATNNETAIGTLSNLNTTEKSNLVGAINEVNTQVSSNTNNISTNTSNIGTLGGNQGDLANLTTTAKNNLVSAINEVNSESDANKTRIENFNLTSFNTYDNNNQYQVTGGTLNNANISVAKNSDGSLCKIYGQFTINDIPQATTPTLKLNVDTGLRPQSAVTINPIGVAFYPEANANSLNVYRPTTITINTDGTIDIGLSTNYAGGTSSARGFLFPCLIFVKDFGDIPE